METDPAAEAAPLGGAFPGWYPDPTGRAAERFWNGRAWTENLKGPAPTKPEGKTPRLSVEPRPERVESEADKVPADPAIDGPVVDGVLVDSPAGGIADAVADAVPMTGRSVRSLSAGTVTEVAGNRSLEERLAEARAFGQAPRFVAAEPEPEPVADDLNRIGSPRGGERRRAPWMLIAIGGVGLFLGGALLGVLAGTNGSSIDATSVEAAPPSNAENATADDDDAEADELRAELDAATAQVATLTEDLEAQEAAAAALAGGLEADQAALTEAEEALANAIAHNELLQTWFTTEVRNRSQAIWDNEVARACAAAGPEPLTAADINYTRAMEVIGTEADAVAAANACAS